MLTLLRLITTQNDQPALMFQGIGFAGSVVAATGCDITYELECTAGTSVCIPHTDVVVSIHFRWLYHIHTTRAFRLTDYGTYNSGVTEQSQFSGLR
jgi:hypothetical protein